MTKEITIGTVIKIGRFQGYDLIPKYDLPPLPEGTELVVSCIPDNNNNKHPEN